MKKWLTFSLFIIIGFILSGCWNYREINSLSIVAGVAIERDPDSGDYILYIEIVEPNRDSHGQTTESKIVETRGKTIFDATRNVIRTSGKRMFWNHAQIIIVNEDVAREGILDVIDWFYRDAEPRLTLQLLVAHGASAKDIITSDGITDEIRSFEINEKLENANSIARYPNTELYQIVDMIKSDVSYAYAPSITIKKQEDTEVSEISGTAVFKEDKLQGFLDQEDTKYFLFAINEIKGGLLVSKKIQDNPDANISLEIFDNKTTVEPFYNNGIITMKIHTETEAAIGESGPNVNYMDKAGLTALKEDMQELLVQNMVRVINKVQHEFDTDIFGFGQIIYQDLPDIWEQYQDNWDTGFKELPFEVSCEIKIRNSAHAGKSLGGAG